LPTRSFFAFAFDVFFDATVTALSLASYLQDIKFTPLIPSP
jgi:hypothetical protein